MVSNPLNTVVESWLTDLAQTSDLYSTFLNLPVMVIADHTGGLLAGSKLEARYCRNPAQQPGFESLIQLAKASRVLIKISGFYRSSDETSTAFADMEPLVSKLARQVPDSLIWGSDWPHTGEGKNRLKGNLSTIEPFRRIDNIAILRNLREWIEDEERWMKLMVHNSKLAFE